MSKPAQVAKKLISLEPEVRDLVLSALTLDPKEQSYIYGYVQGSLSNGHSNGETPTPEVTQDKKATPRKVAQKTKAPKAKKDPNELVLVSLDKACRDFIWKTIQEKKDEKGEFTRQAIQLARPVKELLKEVHGDDLFSDAYKAYIEELISKGKIQRHPNPKNEPALRHVFTVQ